MEGKRVEEVGTHFDRKQKRLTQRKFRKRLRTHMKETVTAQEPLLVVNSDVLTPN